MAFWHEIPLLRFFLAFLAGVVIACSLETTVFIPFILFLIPGIVYSAYLLFPKRCITYRTRWILGLSVYILAAMLGNNVTSFNDSRNNDDWFGKYKPVEYQAIYQVLLQEEPVRKGKYLKAKAGVEKVILQHNNKNFSMKLSGYGLVYIQASTTDSLAYGDRLLIKGKWREPPRALNPGSFDYRSYLFFKHIHHIMYVKNGMWRITGRKQGNKIIALAKNWQNRLVGIYRGNKMGEDEMAVGSAMILGKYENFSDELRSSYSAAGVTHILSVSGLHVGIVFVVFSHLLFFLNRSQASRILKGILLILITWFYALLTGLSPPVMRAAAMFTFLIAGEMRKRKSNILNTLASSALLLMLTDPFLVADIGFELSYLAVAGIVVAGNPLYQLYTPRYYLVDKVWQLVAISIGAQLFTGPLAVYRFMQFPLYFIPANIMIIPLSTLVMYAGMAVLAVEPVPVLARLVNWSFNESLHFMNSLIAWIEKWPYSSLKGLYLSSTEMFILFGFAVVTCLIIHRKYKHIIIYIMILICFYTTSCSVRKSIAYTHGDFYVWSVRKGLAAGFVNGRDIEIYQNTGDRSLFEKQICRHLKASGINKISYNEFTNPRNNNNDTTMPVVKALSWQGKRVMLINGAGRKISNAGSVHADILVISSLHYKAAQQILGGSKPELVILCQDLPFRTSNIVKKYCTGNGIRFFDIREEGAFVMSEYKPEQ